MKRPRAIVICGPTASGKTSFAVELALAIGGEVINADSMQVYRHMDIGTAKPREQEKKGVPHHLIDIVNPDEEFNAAIYRSRALPIIRQIEARNRGCLVVGGTGLYIRGLERGLFDCPVSDGSIRDRLTARWKQEGGEALFSMLSRLDPDYAGRIHRNDRIRILRALEVMELTGRPFSELEKRHGFSERQIDCLKICLDVEREELYARIDSRSMAMVREGLLEETLRLLDMGYSSDLKPMKSIGYRHMVRHIEGEWSLDEATEMLQRDTRRYAKRQLTWFRKEEGAVWMSPGDQGEALEMAQRFLDH